CRNVGFSGVFRMSSGLPATFELLASTANEAAVPVLVVALDSSQGDIRELAFSALLRRHSLAAEGEILRQWDSLCDRWKGQIAARDGWISGAIRQALLRSDPEHYERGCAAAVFTRDYDLIPVLVAAAENKTSPHQTHAAATVLELAELLADELAAPRDYRVRRDPRLQRQHLIGSLERAAAQFEQHGRRELLEALILLADRENAVLKRILQSPTERNFVPLIETLVHSSRPAAMRLLLSYLDDPHAPLAALHALVRRRDISFLRQFARKVGSEPSRTLRTNLHRIETIPWIADQLSLLDAFNESEQPGVVQIAALSGIARQSAFEVLAYVLRHGKVAGRRVAARALAAFAGAAANQLALRSLQDEDPEVRASVARQLRDRGVPAAINRLIALLDSSHQCEREAAQQSLEEFRFSNFTANFDSLTEESRQATGPLVRRVDPQALVELRLELDAPSRGRRKRALEMVVAMDAVTVLHDAVAMLLKDEDQFLRVETVRVLATSDSTGTRALLRDALLDPHPLVAEAAEAALAQLAAVWASKTAQGQGPADIEMAEETASAQPQATEALAATTPWSELTAATNAES
ncbi:MAG TPA: HEAT repeat domain-containing protein, partial [Pirellulaceae bacterium]|nr:HEAT repeat domain-containing protein [Pirellulaceae bacterium]